MTRSLRPLCDWVDQDEWPHVPCPACGDGRVTPEILTPVSSAETERLKDHAGWDPDWDRGVFHGLLRCTLPKCAEPVVVVGEYRIEAQAQYVDDSRGGYVSLLRLRYAQPPLALIDCPPRTPDTVRAAVAAASQLVWADPGAAANRLRLATEELLTAQRVPRTAVVQGKPQRRLNTHQRIERFRAKNGAAADALMAVKWIGNEGSHADALTAKDVLDGATVLSLALNLLYDSSAEELQRHIRRVNKAKGLPKAAKTRTVPKTP